MQKNGIPKYQEIETDIFDKIQHKIYKPSSKLSSENQMAEYYNTSVPTVRKALSELVHRKIIYRIKGSGTYVCDSKPIKSEKALNICFLVFTEFTDSSIMKLIRGAQTALFAQGHSLSILCKTETTSSESEMVQTCHKNSVDGIIYFSEDPVSCENSFQLISEYKIPAVMIDRGPKHYPHTLVAAYNIDGGYQMTKYLLGLGHRKIAFVVVNEEGKRLKAEEDRHKGYRMALREKGIPEEDELCIQWKPVGDRLVELVKEHLITAIQGANDKVAAEVIQRMQREGIRVPEDVSVGGFDEWDEVKYVIPKVTTIFQPFEEMGRVASEKIIGMLENNATDSQTYLPVKLVIKDSCSPPKYNNEGEKGENL